MKIVANTTCNVRTAEHTSNQRLKVDITMPQFRANLTIEQARTIATHLTEAADIAEAELHKMLHT